MTRDEPTEADATGDDSSSAPQPDSPHPPGDPGWVDLGGPSVWRLIRGIAVSGGSLWLIQIYTPAFLIYWGIRQLIRNDGGWALVLVMGSLFAVVLVVSTVWIAMRRRAPSLSLTLRQFRRGSRATSFTDVNFARLHYQRAWRNLDVYLCFGSTDRPNYFVLLDSRRMTPIDASARKLLASALAESTIVVPQARGDRYDPTGKFASIGMTQPLSREKAIDLVLRESAPRSDLTPDHS